MNRPAALFLALLIAGAVFVASLDAGPIEACGRAIITLLLAAIAVTLLTRSRER